MKPVPGVYAIHGPNGVYVGQSVDCWKRDSFLMAMKLGLECGIVREVSLRGASRQHLPLQRAEVAVAEMFRRRGFRVVSEHHQDSLPATIKRELFSREVA
jgi:hypothetical protein